MEYYGIGICYISEQLFSRALLSFETVCIMFNYHRKRITMAEHVGDWNGTSDIPIIN